jgi:hypothetical protein
MKNQITAPPGLHMRSIPGTSDQHYNTTDATGPGYGRTNHRYGHVAPTYSTSTFSYHRRTHPGHLRGSLRSPSPKTATTGPNPLSNHGGTSGYSKTPTTSVSGQGTNHSTGTRTGTQLGFHHTHPRCYTSCTTSKGESYPRRTSSKGDSTPNSTGNHHTHRHLSPVTGHQTANQQPH